MSRPPARAIVQCSRMQVTTSCTRPPLGHVIVHVVGGEELDPGMPGQLRQPLQAASVIAAIAMAEDEMEPAPPVTGQLGQPA